MERPRWNERVSAKEQERRRAANRNIVRDQARRSIEEHIHNVEDLVRRALPQITGTPPSPLEVGGTPWHARLLQRTVLECWPIAQHKYKFNPGPLWEKEPYDGVKHIVVVRNGKLAVADLDDDRHTFTTQHRWIGMAADLHGLRFGVQAKPALPATSEFVAGITTLLAS